MSLTADDFAAPSGTSFKFEEPGDTISGIVTYVGPFQERTNKFTDREEQVARLGIDVDGETLYIWPVKGSSMAQAIGEALRESGGGTLAVGDELAVKYAENVDTGKPQPMKKFRAKHTPAKPTAGGEEW
jgi:hypothetical protein